MAKKRTKTRRKGRSRRRERERGRSSRDYSYGTMDADAAQERMDQAERGDREPVVTGEVSFYRPGDNNDIRILPPTWKKPRHYGYDVYVHYGIGADNSTIICPARMEKGDCPVCEERKQAEADGDTDYAKRLRPKKRCAVYLIDRRKEEDGVQFWMMPAMVDDEILAQAFDEKNNEMLPLAHPEEGFDVEFKRKSLGKRVDQIRYVGIKVSRHSSPLADDEDTMQEWLEYAEENPIPDRLIIHDHDKIAKIFEGGTGGKDKKDSKDEGYSWDEIHGMEYDDLVGVIEEEDLDIDYEESESDEELAGLICEELEIERPSRSRKGRDKKGKRKRTRARRPRDEEEEEEPEEEEEEEPEEEEEEEPEEEEEEDDEDERKARMRRMRKKHGRGGGKKRGKKRRGRRAQR